MFNMLQSTVGFVGFSKVLRHLFAMDRSVGAGLISILDQIFTIILYAFRFGVSR